MKVSRLSPNEEAQLVREELQRRRKLRLQQVREQERSIALQVRRDVQERRARELQSLGTTLRDEWQKQRGERIEMLEKLYKENLRDVGQGHRSAKENEPDREALALKKERNETQAAERHQKALRSLLTHRQAEAEQRNRHVEARKKALIVEKERAANIASLPQSAPDPIECVTVKTPIQPKMSNMQHYSITHYHVPETAVDREADTVQPDAQEAAEYEARRLEGLEKEETCGRQEQLERARLRGDHALRKEKGIQNNARLLCELERLQQAELQRRRHAVNSVPAQIFQPLYRHHELRAEQQRELENAFLDLCTEDKEIRDDLVLQLVSEPLPPPVPSAKTDSTPELDLDVTLEPNETPCEEEEKEKDSGQDPVASQSSLAPADGTGRMALRRLLNRIRTQRDQWNRMEPPVGRGEVRVENIDNEHGSAGDVEWQQASSLEEGTVETSLAENNSKVTEDSIADEPTVQPDEQNVDTDLRSRDDGLNRQQVEQFALLQELEEKRRSLELQLEEAKLHRRRLQDALQVSSGIQESPLQEMLSEPSPEESVSAPSSDNMHKNRLHQYQQRLLKQNLLHQQTIDQARQSLEEYKQALKTRYALVAMAATEIPAPSEAVYSVPPLPDGTRSNDILNSDTESRISLETTAMNIKQSRDNTTLAGTAFLLQPSPPSHSPVLSMHPDTGVTPQPVSMPIGNSHSIPQTADASLLDETLPGTTREYQDVPLLPPAVFLEYLRNRRLQNPLTRPTPITQLQEEVRNSDPHQDRETEKNQEVRERIQKQKALQALLRAHHAKDLSLDDDGVIDAPVKERSDEPLLVSSTSSQSHANSQQTPVLGSSEPPLWESSSNGRVNPPVSCPPRTLQILLHDFEQHKLSTIEEVDTPVNVTMDTAAEVHMANSSVESSYYSSLTPPTKGSESSQGPSSGSEVTGSEFSTSGPSKMSWREMLDLESEATDSSENQQQEEELVPVLPPDGASGVPDFLSSTTLSTGSYVSSDHEPNLNVTDNSLLNYEFPARPGTSRTCSISSNSLQHIIDKYTKELDTSLRTVHTGGSISELTALESRSTLLSISSEAGLLRPAQPPTFPLQCNVEDSNSLNTTLHDTFQSLSPEITNNNDVTERSATFQLSLTPPVENSSTNTTASDWLDRGVSQLISATDGQSSFSSAGFPQWEWTLGNNSKLNTPEASVSHGVEDFSLQNVGEVVIRTLPEKKQDLELPIHQP